MKKKESKKRIPSDGWNRFLIFLPRRGAMLMMQEKETGGMGHLEVTGAGSFAIPGEDDSG